MAAAAGGAQNGGEGRPRWRRRPPGYPLTERRGGDRAPEGEVRAEGGSRRLQAGPLLAGGAGGGGRRCGSAAGRRWPGCCSRCVCGRRCRAAAPQVRDEGRPEVPQRTAATAGGTAVGGRAEIRGFLFLNHLSLLNSHPPSLGLLPLDSKRPSACWVPVVQRTLRSLRKGALRVPHVPNALPSVLQEQQRWSLGRWEEASSSCAAMSPKRPRRCCGSKGTRTLFPHSSPRGSPSPRMSVSPWWTTALCASRSCGCRTRATTLVKKC